MEFDLSGSRSPVHRGFGFDVAPMQIDARLTLLNPGGQGTSEPPPTSRAPVVDLSSATRSTEIGRSNVQRADGVDDVSTNIEALYELYRALSGRVYKQNHKYFVAAGMQQQSVSNDSVLDDAAAFGSLTDRAAAFVAQLQDRQPSQSTMLPLEAMSKEEVIRGLVDGTIVFNAGAEQAFYDAATGTQAQITSNFPLDMQYPLDLEMWILALARTPNTRTLFAALAQAYMNEFDASSPSISSTSSTLAAIMPVALKPSQLLITSPYKEQVLANLAAVSGVPVRSKKLTPLDYLYY